MAKKTINELKRYKPKFTPGYIPIQANAIEEWLEKFNTSLKQDLIKARKTLKLLKKLAAESDNNENK